MGKLGIYNLNLALRAKLQWSKIYKLTLLERAALVDHIIADVPNHQMLIRNTNPPVLNENDLPLQVAVVENPDALLNVQEDEEQLENVDDAQDFGSF